MICAHCNVKIGEHEPVYVIEHTKPVHAECFLEYVGAIFYETTEEAEADFKMWLKGE